MKTAPLRLKFRLLALLGGYLISNIGLPEGISNTKLITLLFNVLNH